MEPRLSSLRTDAKRRYKQLRPDRQTGWSPGVDRVAASLNAACGDIPCPRLTEEHECHLPARHRARKSEGSGIQRASLGESGLDAQIREQDRRGCECRGPDMHIIRAPAHVFEDDWCSAVSCDEAAV